MAPMMKYEYPSPYFPYKISRRLNALSVPRKMFFDTYEPPPAVTESGTRRSALYGHPTDRLNEISWPWIRRLVIVKKMYKNRFSQDRLERIERMIEAANSTVYSKLARCVIDLKRQDGKDLKKKKGWTETEWKKHMDYIGMVAAPKKEFKPPPIKRGKSMPLDALMPRIKAMAYMPDFKCYKRMSQEDWYRNPEKVPPNALKYVISERIKKLAAPRQLPPQD